MSADLEGQTPPGPASTTSSGTRLAATCRPCQCNVDERHDPIARLSGCSADSPCPTDRRSSSPKGSSRRVFGNERRTVYAPRTTRARIRIAPVSRMLRRIHRMRSDIGGLQEWMGRFCSSIAAARSQSAGPMGCVPFHEPPPALHPRPSCLPEPPTLPAGIIRDLRPPRKAAVAGTGPSEAPRPLPLERGSGLRRCDTRVARPFESPRSTCDQGWPGSCCRRGLHQRPFA